MRRAEPASHRACRLISFLNEFVSEENKGQDAQLFLRCFVFNSRKWASCPASFATLSDAESYSRERGAAVDGSEKRKDFGNISCFRKGLKKKSSSWLVNIYLRYLNILLRFPLLFVFFNLQSSRKWIHSFSFANRWPNVSGCPNFNDSFQNRNSDRANLSRF